MAHFRKVVTVYREYSTNWIEVEAMTDGFPVRSYPIVTPTRATRVNELLKWAKLNCFISAQVDTVGVYLSFSIRSDKKVSF